MSAFDLVRTRTLVEIARRGSIAAAAEELGYTQSAVSQQLSTLERDVGFTLVDRSQRPLRVTRAGAELIPEVEALLARVASLDAVVDDLRGVRRGRVDVVGFSSSLATVVASAIEAFRADGAADEVRVGVTEREPPAALAAIRSGEADVAVVHFTDRHELEGLADLDVRALGDDPLVLALPADHRLAGGSRPLPVEAVAGEPLIVPRATGAVGGFRRLMEQHVGPGLRIGYEIDDVRAAQGFVAAGLGVALVYKLALLRPLPPTMKVRRVTPADPRGVAVVTAAGRRAPAAAALAALMTLPTATD